MALFDQTWQVHIESFYYISILTNLKHHHVVLYIFSSFIREGPNRIFSNLFSTDKFDISNGCIDMNDDHVAPEMSIFFFEINIRIKATQI